MLGHINDLAGYLTNNLTGYLASYARLSGFAVCFAVSQMANERPAVFKASCAQR